MKEVFQGKGRAGLSDLIEGGSKLMAPVGAITAPFDVPAALGATAVSSLAQKGTEWAAHKLGASPETTRLASDIAGVGGGIVGTKAPEVVGAVPEVAGVARNAMRPLQQRAAESVLGPVTYENVGETGADVRAGINPERGIASEKGMTGSKAALAGQEGKPGKILGRVGELKTAANKIIDNHPNGNVQVDAGQHIDAAIDGAIQQAEKIAGSTERLENLRQALKTKFGATQGTPRQMNDLATAIQREAKALGAYKNTQPIEASAGSAMSDAARRIRGNVNQLIPEAAPVNQRMADLLDAQQGVMKHLNAERGQSMFGGFGRGIISSIFDKTLGSASLRTRLASLLNAGNKLPKP